MKKNFFKNENLKIFTFFLATILLVGTFFGPVLVFGDAITPCDPNRELCNPIRFNNIFDLFKEVLRIAAEIGTVFVVVGFVYSGFLFVKAQGNQEELSKAKRSLTYTVIGAAIVLGAWAFSVAISETIKGITNTAR